MHTNVNANVDQLVDSTLLISDVLLTPSPHILENGPFFFFLV